MKYTLPQLEYKFNELEPHFDAATMELHYSKHHQTYCDKFNAVLEKYPTVAELPLEVIFETLDELPVDETDRKAIRNMGGGFINHNFFWSILSPQKAIDEVLIKDIEATFGSLEDFKTQFTDLATKHFASGWAWLVRDENNQLKMYSLPNQDSPLTLGHKPVLTIDLWEHAYYLKFQNRRAEYISAWWNVLKFI